MPDTLVPTLNKEPLFRTISFGEGGAYFWIEMPKADSAGSYCVSAATTVNYPRVKAIYDSGEIINWVAFGPDGAFVIDTTNRLIASDPTMARTYDRNGVTTRVPTRCASFGPEGVWVIVEDDGEIRSRGLPAKVLSALSKKGVRKVELSPVSSNYYFIEYTDGSTDWCLPASWHPQVRNIGQLNLAGVRKIVFAFGPEREAYCIKNQGRTAWKGLPEELSQRLREPGSISAVSVGEGGAFFWKTGKSYCVSAATKMAYPKVWKIWQSDEEINWVAFGPEGYYIVATPKRIYASRQDEIIRTYKESKRQVPIRCASFGWGGSWVIIEDDGTVRSHRLKPNVRKAILQASVKSVALSWVDPTRFYIEYMNQTSAWSLPVKWHPTVSDIEGNPASKVERLEKLTANSPEYNTVEYQFTTSWRHTNKKRPLIRRIYKVVLMKDVWDRYVRYRFGGGIYTSSASSKAAIYAQNHAPSAYKAMLLNKVAVGRSYFTGVADNGWTAPPPGYNSVCGLPGDVFKHDETIVYDDDAIRPQYLIIYEDR
ncbi:hypothetical protein FRC04_011595 [Tulasnella sp. 424]|nr:hypothetical protein FRC04_011595 [Tulasnella sp. 424]